MRKALRGAQVLSTDCLPANLLMLNSVIRCRFGISED